jgi:hypothetical protein
MQTTAIKYWQQCSGKIVLTAAASTPVIDANTNATNTELEAIDVNASGPMKAPRLHVMLCNPIERKINDDDTVNPTNQQLKRTRDRSDSDRSIHYKAVAVAQTRTPCRFPMTCKPRRTTQRSISFARVHTANYLHTAARLVIALYASRVRTEKQCSCNR